MTKKNLFIVRSPLQLLNAIEAKDYFKTDNNELVIIHTKANINEKNKLLIESIIKNYQLESSFNIRSFYQDGNKSKLLKMVKFIKFLQKNVYQRVFIADAGSIQMVMVANLETDEIIHLDDGTKTIEKQENKLFLPQTYKNLKLSRKLRYLRYYLFGLQPFITKPIDLFTIFNIQAQETQKIFKNEYSYLKKSELNHKNHDNDTIYFVGQGLVEAHIVSEQFYINLLKNIKQEYLAKKIVYMPHRGEKITKEKLALVDDFFQITSPTLPIELEFLSKKTYPMHIIGIASTALFTLAILFEEANVSYYKIPDTEYLNSDKREVWNNIYSYFKHETKLNLLPLNFSKGFEV